MVTKVFKYFIGYTNGYENIRPLWIIFSKMSAYWRDFDKAKCMPFLIKDNEIWDKVSNTIKKGVDSKPVYNEKLK